VNQRQQAGGGLGHESTKAQTCWLEAFEKPRRAYSERGKSKEKHFGSLG